MSTHNYKCTNLANECEKALTREVIEIQDGEEQRCPDCGAKLAPVKKENMGTAKKVLAGAAAACVLCLAAIFGIRFHQTQKTGLASSSATSSPGLSKTVEYPCGLKPVPAADAARLLQYLKQGMSYVSQKNPRLAMNEFEQILRSDPNFLGVQMNIGAAQLAIRKYPEAEAAFNQELKLIGCLKQMNDEQLGKFAYMQEAGIETEANNGKDLQRASLLRSRLDRAEANVHYNLACLTSLQQQNGRAMTELEKALAGGLIDKKMLQTDPDLQQVRRTAEFKKLMTGYSPAITGPRSSP
jgi:DNA-directed RNA polymerase subunit RPC12/RpoP